MRTIFVHLTNVQYRQAEHALRSLYGKEGDIDELAKVLFLQMIADELERESDEAMMALNEKELSEIEG